MSPSESGVARHYDRVTEAWRLLLGPELHYGLFRSGSEELSEATRALTQLMAEVARPASGTRLLDVGCGTGAPACWLASNFGVSVTGISTSGVGVRASQERARAAGLAHLTSFQQRDATRNGLPDESFERVWVLEASHLMRDRAALFNESARVLKPGGRFVLCDIVLRRAMPFSEVRRLRHPLALLREVFGDAHMLEVDSYVGLAQVAGLRPETPMDLTAATRPTFERWRDNAAKYRDEVVDLIGQQAWQAFIDASVVLQRFWDDETLGYALVSATKPDARSLDHHRQPGRGP